MHVMHVYKHICVLCWTSFRLILAKGSRNVKPGTVKTAISSLHFLLFLLFLPLTVFLSLFCSGILACLNSRALELLSTYSWIFWKAPDPHPQALSPKQPSTWTCEDPYEHPEPQTLPPTRNPKTPTTYVSVYHFRIYYIQADLMLY